MATKDLEEAIEFWDRNEVQAASNAYRTWLTQPAQTGIPDDELLAALEYCRPVEADEIDLSQDFHQDQNLLLFFASQHLEMFQMSSPFTQKFRDPLNKAVAAKVEL